VTVSCLAKYYLFPTSILLLKLTIGISQEYSAQQTSYIPNKWRIASGQIALRVLTSILQDAYVLHNATEGNTCKTDNFIYFIVLHPRCYVRLLPNSRSSPKYYPYLC
jgi:hypothetical protein